mgnify:FL=1
MKFSVTFRENSISLNKLNTVMNGVIGGITCLIAEDEWERLSWLETNDFGKDDVREFAQKFLDQCFFSNSSPEEMYNKILNDFHMNDKQFSVSRKMIPTGITGKKHVIADRYYIDTLEDLIILEMLYAIERNISFIKCRHCSKYFASANAGAAYCDRKNENGKTCKQIAAKRTFSETLKADETLAIHEKAYQSLYYKSRKATDEKETKMYKTKMAVLRRARMDYKNGKISSDKLIGIIEKNK